MKSIKELNEKWWYRLIKVIYIILAIIVFLVYNALVFSGGWKSVDYNKTIITCNLTGDKMFSLEESGAYFASKKASEYDYKNFAINDSYYYEKIVNKCLSGIDLGGNTISKLSSEDIKKIQKTGDAKKDGLNDFLEAGLDTLPLTYNMHLFDISFQYEYPVLSLDFILGNIVIIVLLWLARGTFYYIIIGKFKLNW